MFVKFDDESWNEHRLVLPVFANIELLREQVLKRWFPRLHHRFQPTDFPPFQSFGDGAEGRWERQLSRRHETPAHGTYPATFLLTLPRRNTCSERHSPLLLTQSATYPYLSLANIVNLDRVDSLKPPATFQRSSPKSCHPLSTNLLNAIPLQFSCQLAYNLIYCTLDVILTTLFGLGLRNSGIWKKNENQFQLVGAPHF